MKDPDKILDAFKTRSDQAARVVGELRDARDRTLKHQVQVLQQIETAYQDTRKDRMAAQAAAGYAKRCLQQAAALRREAEKIAEAEVLALHQLERTFGDQKRFEVYLSQRQLKEKAVARKREENALLEQIDQLQAAKARKEAE
ncbi:hypothetical protein [Parvularcula lutaonensis]|uniref:Flagellar FliJ protein n=1 Tax=Parvularcula lutaonensis TaxID=491923 RepID=A0ABV7MEC0_9PROT|nr:hypothetical protein [Parvularcula lutaonensis]GGY50581.1 hypothetical protein GCM10007148_19230 [Parvularcula lutaonensis]